MYKTVLVLEKNIKFAFVASKVDLKKEQTQNKPARSLSKK